MEYSLLSAFVMFLLITDPLGNIPLFVTSLKKIEKEKPRDSESMLLIDKAL